MKKTWRPGRILIIRFGAIGDVVLTTALIRQIRVAFPQAGIEYLVKSRHAGLLANNPALTRIWTFESGLFVPLLRTLCARRYDGIVDLQSSLRSRIFAFLIPARRKVRVRIGRLRRLIFVRFRRDGCRTVRDVPDKYLEAVRSWGVTDDDGGLEIHPGEGAEAVLSGLLESSGVSPGQKLLVLAPGAGRATKRWPPERFAETGAYFRGKGFAVILVGAGDDTGVCHETEARYPHLFVNLCGRLRIEETAALLTRSTLLITNDTGVMHIAAAVECPVVAIFGPTTRHFGFFPFRASHVVVERDMDCRPCSFHGTSRCPENHFGCMRGIDAGRVIRAAETLLGTEGE